MPLQATSGAASYDAFGGGVAAVPNYIEDVFSTYLYTGTGNSVTQRIASGIDLATKGGMVWVKNRTEATDHQIYDTARGQRKYIRSNTTDAEFDSGANQVQYKTSGWDAFEYTNELNKVMASWTFRKQPKFFDVVTFTKSSSPQTISHNLGSTPGCIFIKRTDSTGAWLVAHRGYTGGITAGYTLLNTTDAFTSNANAVTAVDSTTFTLGSAVVSGDFVAYLFAHNAGGFGLTGTDNVISCGSFDATSAGSVELGYEPQWVLIKASNDVGSWHLQDNMRGYTTSGNNPTLDPDRSVAEFSGGYTNPTATGFKYGGMGSSFIYIAIRRGPMKVPTSGTSVFSPVARTGTGTITTVTAGFAPDLAISAKRTSGEYMPLADKLRGPTRSLFWQQGKTDAEDVSYAGQWFTAFTTTGVVVGPDDGGGQAVNASSTSFIQYYFQRAPSFFDAVCYTGTGSATTQTHNLGTVPELIIVKSRSASGSWAVYSAALGNTGILFLNTTAANAGPNTQWNSTTPTSTIFSIGSNSEVNFSGRTYVAYLFATCAGVSKVGSYTGTGTLTTINCGFTGGARYVLIKRTDSTSDWLMWDTARGMVSGTDPSISSNYQGAEINANSVYTVATGFQLLASPSADVNTNGGSYIFLAIA